MSFLRILYDSYEHIPKTDCNNTTATPNTAETPTYVYSKTVTYIIVNGVAQR